MSAPRTAPSRHDVLLALARADGQPWESIAEATPHTAEVMYGRQADAIEALWRKHSGPEDEPAPLLDPSHHWGTRPLMERIKPGTRIRVRDIPVCLNCLVDGCEGETAAFEPCRRIKNPAHHKECTTDE